MGVVTDLATRELAPFEVRLFYSYAADDESFRTKLEGHLAVVRRLGLLRTWSQLEVQPGDAESQTVDEALADADVVLLLVSSDYLSSDGCDQQVHKALRHHHEGRCQVVPILLRPVQYDLAPFSELPCLPAEKRPISLWEEEDLAWQEVAEGIQRVVEEIAIRRWLERRTHATSRRVLCRLSASSAETWVTFGPIAELGRSETCDIPLRLAPKSVSKRHARILWLPAAERFAIQDLHSRHGTYVDGIRISRLTLLHHDQVVTLGGGISFRFEEVFGATALGMLTYQSDTGEALGRYALAAAGVAPLQPICDTTVRGELRLDHGGISLYDAAGPRTQIRPLSSSGVTSVGDLSMEVQASQEISR